MIPPRICFGVSQLGLTYGYFSKKPKCFLLYLGKDTIGVDLTPFSSRGADGLWCFIY